ncbi:MAG: phosphomethylpyrimidine synthase ThiC [Evtepia sp.]
MRDYATQMEAAKKGIITPEMKTVAEKEYTDPEMIRARVALGQIAIPANINHKSLCAEGIGKGLRTKINVNLGISGDAKNHEVELDKVRMALKFGAEAIMDLSNYGKTNTFRKQLIDMSPADDRHRADVRRHRLSGKGPARDHRAGLPKSRRVRTPEEAWTL